MLKKFSVRENARVAKAIVQAVEKLPLAALSVRGLLRIPYRFEATLVR